MYIAILGRQPKISSAEIERIFGNITEYSETTSLFRSPKGYIPNIEDIGGSQKIGKVILDVDTTDWKKLSAKISQHYTEKFGAKDGKITLGISSYGFDVSAREVQKIGLVLKSKLKQKGVGLRLIPNQNQSLSTATSHHNKLGLSGNKIELIIAKGAKTTIVAESIGSQNITALAARDQGRPKRDALVGMLPPKLAQIIVNLALGEKVIKNAQESSKLTILDPFCGTGVLLQESMLLGHDVYGTDLSEKMIDYTETNLNWLTDKYNLKTKFTLHAGDAMDVEWTKTVDAVATESYLGQPFSAPPTAKKLEEVKGNCNHIISSFLRNIGSQIETGTSLCVAVPAWRNKEGSITTLPLTTKLNELGYKQVSLRSARPADLIYYRENQVVARQLLILEKL